MRWNDEIDTAGSGTKPARRRVNGWTRDRVEATPDEVETRTTTPPATAKPAGAGTAKLEGWSAGVAADEWPVPARLSPL